MFGLGKLNIQKMIPNWKPLTIFFLVLWGGKFAASRAGMGTQTATALIVLALGAFIRIFNVKIKWLDANLSNVLYELGIAMTAQEFMRKTLTLKNITGAYKAIVFGTPTAAANPGTVRYNTPKMMEG